MLLVLPALALLQSWDTQATGLLAHSCLQGFCTLFVDSGGSSRCSWCRSCCSLSSLSRRQIRPSYCDLRALIRTSSSAFCSSNELLFCFHSSFSFVSCSFAPKRKEFSLATVSCLHMEYLAVLVSYWSIVKSLKYSAIKEGLEGNFNFHMPFFYLIAT